MTPHVTADAADRYRREQASALKRRGVGRLVARIGVGGTRPGAGNARRVRSGHGVVRAHS